MKQIFNSTRIPTGHLIVLQKKIKTILLTFFFNMRMHITVSFTIFFLTFQKVNLIKNVRSLKFLINT